MWLYAEQQETSMRVIIKTGFEVLYPDSRSHFTPNTEPVLWEVPLGKREWTPHPRPSGWLRDLSFSSSTMALSAQVCSPNME